MSDDANPNKELSAYERWEMPNFGPSDGTRQKYNEPPIILPTAVQLEEIQRQAHDEGYQAGFAEGNQAGFAEGNLAGFAEGKQQGYQEAYAERKQDMETLLNSMEQALLATDQEIAQDLLKLSLEVARQMVQQVIKTNPEILLNTIRVAIASLPHFNQGAHLVLHPDDASIVRAEMAEHLSHSGWKIFEDAQITRGGARVETSHSQIDATLENRWQRIVASIGQDSSWIQE